jgi:hypothetical protein
MSSAATVLPLRARRDEAASIELSADDLWPNTPRLLPWSLAAFLAMLWLVPFNAISIGIPLPVDRWPLAAMTGLWLVALMVDGRLRPHVELGPIHAALAAFFVVSVATLWLNIGLLTNLNELHLATKKLTALVAYSVFFVVAVSILRPGELQRFVKLTIGLSVLTALAAVIEYRSDYNVFYDLGVHFYPGIVVPEDLHGVDYVGRQTTYGPTDTPLELSTQLAMAAPLAVVGALEATDRLARARYGLALGIILAGIFATERKTGIITGAVGAAVLLAYRPVYFRRVIKLGLVLAVVLHLLAPGAMGSIRVQLSPDHLFGTLSNRDRASDYGAVTPDVLKRPAFGRGYASYEPYKYRILDNEWLGLLIQTGIVGVAAFAALLATALATAHGTIRARAPGVSSIALACSCAVAGFIASAALFDSLAFPHVMYSLSWTLVLLVTARRAHGLLAPPPGPRGGRPAEATPIVAC